MSPAKTYSTIHGLSAVRRLPRLGKIRLGVKVKKSKPDSRCKHKSSEICMFCTYPKEVPHFVCPPNVQKIYGKEPKELDVMLPVENERVSFPQAYKWYVASHLKCKGDGQTAMRRVEDLTEEQRKELNGDVPRDKNDLVEIPCPCPLLESGKCSQMGNLMILLPKVSMGGIFQIDTGSVNNIIRINSAIDYIRGLLTTPQYPEGRVALIPLKLKRVPEVIEYEGKKATHYLLSLEFEGDINSVNQLRSNTQRVLEDVKSVALPPPVESGPEPTGEVIVEESSWTMLVVEEISEKLKSPKGTDYWTLKDTEGASYFCFDESAAKILSESFVKKTEAYVQLKTEDFGTVITKAADELR